MGDYATEVADDLRHNFTMPPETPTREVFEEALGPCTYLYLHRRDKIRQAISFLRARQSGVWRVEHSDANHSEAPRFDAEAIDRYRARFIQQDAFWTQYFREGNISPLTLYYEDIVADDRSAVVRRILNYLQIAQGTDVAIHPPQTIKQADAISEEWYDRYKLLRN